MLDAFASSLAFAADTPIADAVQTAVDQPAVGHVLAYAIAIAAVLAIGALLLHWRGRRTAPVVK